MDFFDMTNESLRKEIFILNFETNMSVRDVNIAESQTFV